MGEVEDKVEAASPCGRWYRYAKRSGEAAGPVVAKGSFKVVYLAFDREFGREVAWNVVNLEHTSATLTDQAETDRLEREFHVMKHLVNPNIVRCYGGWRDEDGVINFITELFTSGTLKDYRKKHTDLDIEKAINGWGRSILSGLAFLHAQTPPIVHRDLRCEYCYVNGNTGEVKVADLGRAKFLFNDSQAAATIAGGNTKGNWVYNYTAPELYDDDKKYGTAVDMFAFGLLLLELFTMRRPYEECKTPADVYRAVHSGTPPAALQDVSDNNIQAIIKACLIIDPAARPSANELLQLDLFRELPPDEVIQVTGHVCEGNRKLLKLEITISRPSVKRMRYEFSLNTDCDTAKSITTEMMEVLQLSEEEAAVVAGKIQNTISKLQPEDKSSNEMKLVRIPSKSTDPSMTDDALVVVTRDVADKDVLHVEFTALSDRRNLLFNVVRTLRDFPLEVQSALYSTEQGAVLEDLRLKVLPGQKVDIEELEKTLTDALNNEPPSPVPTAGQYMASRPSAM